MHSNIYFIMAEKKGLVNKFVYYLLNYYKRVDFFQKIGKI